MIALTTLSIYLGATFTGILTLIGLGAMAVTGAVIGWKVSGLFIPPRDHWVKSFFGVFLVKLGIAATGAYFAVIGGAYLGAAILAFASSIF